MSKAVVVETALPGVLVIEPAVFGDDRGFFFESFNARLFESLTGVATSFVQDNHSRSAHGVLRGIHYQVTKPQGKLVRAVTGSVVDVAVDLRRSSTHFGRWVAVELSADNKRSLWVPPGFGHGFVVTSAFADFLYKTTDYWHPEHERGIRWNDESLAIDWQLDGEPVLADKDARAPFLADAECYA